MELFTANSNVFAMLGDMIHHRYHLFAVAHLAQTLGGAAGDCERIRWQRKSPALLADDYGAICTSYISPRRIWGQDGSYNIFTV